MQRRCRLFVIEAALLENHYDAICDEMWYIYAGAEDKTASCQKQGYDSARINRR